MFIFHQRATFLHTVTYIHTLEGTPNSNPLEFTKQLNSNQSGSQSCLSNFLF